MSEYASTSEESNSNEFERSYKYNTETAAINIKNNKAIWRFSLEDNRIVKISRDRRVAPNEIAIIPKFQQKMVGKTMKRNHIQYCSKIENCMNWKWCTKKKKMNKSKSISGRLWRYKICRKCNDKDSDTELRNRNLCVEK